MRKAIYAGIIAGTILQTTAFSVAQAATKVEINQPAICSSVSDTLLETAIEELTKKDAIMFKTEKSELSKPIAKSEFVYMLRNALDIQIAYLVAPDIKHYFDDVAQDAIYTSALIDLLTVNIVDDEGRVFNPNANISKEKMYHYMINAYKYKMGGMPADTKELFKNSQVMLKSSAYIVTRAEAVIDVWRLANCIGKRQERVAVTPGATINDTSIQMKLDIANNTKNAVTINFTSGQKYDFVLLDKNRNELYRWSDGRMFTMALESKEIGAGKSIKYQANLSGDQYRSIKDKIAYLKAYITGSSHSFTINADGYEIKLK